MKLLLSSKEQFIERRRCGKFSLLSQGLVLVAIGIRSQNSICEMASLKNLTRGAKRKKMSYIEK